MIVAANFFGLVDVTHWWIENQDIEVLKHWLIETPNPMLVSQLDGSILWCNPAFEKLLDYAIVEIVGKKKWTELTNEKEDLKHDLEMAKEVYDGHRQDYELQKEYRNKSGSPVEVIIHVLRYPPGKDPMDFYLVTVTPLNKGLQFAVQQIAEIRSQMFDLVEVVSKPKPNFLQRAFEWSKESNANKAIFWCCVALAVYLVVGDRLFEVLSRTQNLLKGMPE